MNGKNIPYKPIGMEFEHPPDCRHQAECSKDIFAGSQNVLKQPALLKIRLQSIQQPSYFLNRFLSRFSPMKVKQNKNNTDKKPSNRETDKVYLEKK